RDAVAEHHLRSGERHVDRGRPGRRRHGHPDAGGDGGERGAAGEHGDEDGADRGGGPEPAERRGERDAERGDDPGPPGGGGGEQRDGGGGRGGDVHGDGAQPRAEPGDGRRGHRRAAGGPDLRVGDAVAGDVRLRHGHLDGGNAAGDAAGDAVAAGAGRAGGD